MTTLAPKSPVLATLCRFMPALDALRTYRVADARADFAAGLTVAAVAVPQAMAYAMVAGLPPAYGLYGAIVMTMAAGLFDGSRRLINGPTNATSIAVLSVAAKIVATDERVQAVMVLAFMVGAIQLCITVLRAGDLSRYISHSVIVGFTFGAGILLVLDQLKNLLGLKAVGGPHDHFLYRFYRSLVDGGAVHPQTAALGLGSIVLVLMLRWAKQRLGVRLFPELLFVVVIAAVAVARLGLEEQGVKVIGNIPARLPAFKVPAFDAVLMHDFAGGALAIAVLGLLEAISMAKAIAAPTRQKLDMNQQCLSEGVGNLVGSFFQCFPGSGSLTRSAINHQAGASTQWAGIVSAFAVALTMLVFAPFARFIPRAALAGILMVSAYKMVDWRALAYHFRATRFDAVIVAATAVSAVVISVEFCVLIGVFMSFLLAVPRVSQILRTEFVMTAQGGIHERLPDDPVCDQILIFGLEGEMFFGAASSLERHLDVIEERANQRTKVIVLRMKRARNPDAVGLGLLDGFLDRMQARNVHVILCGVRAELYAQLEKAGLTHRLGEQQLFLEQPVRQTSTLLAVRHACALIPEPCATCPRRDAALRDQDLYYAV